VQVSPSAPSADPGEDRYRLLNAVASFLRNAASVQPLVIVLEDLHDADRGTPELLQNLARQLQGSRLLLVGTYRDVEVDRTHPLPGTVAELRRGGRLERIALRGLTADEVGATGDAVGLNVSVKPDLAAFQASGPVPLDIRLANHALAGMDGLVALARAPEARSDSQGPIPEVVLDSAQLVYVVASDGAYGYFEPAVMFSGQFAQGGVRYEKRVIVPALDPSNLR